MLCEPSLYKKTVYLLVHKSQTKGIYRKGNSCSPKPRNYTGKETVAVSNQGIIQERKLLQRTLVSKDIAGAIAKSQKITGFFFG